MHCSQAGLTLIEGFEGYSYSAYWDAYGHCWTVGYGETHNVGPNTTMTRAQAQADLVNRLERDFEPAINRLGVPLSQHQYDALCSFVWNLGPGSMQWDVGRYLRERNYIAAGNALLEYIHSNGQIVAALVTRRKAERELFFTPDPPTDPYLIFEDQTFGLAPTTERETMRLIDGALHHPVKYATWILELNRRAKLYRDRIWHIAHASHGGGWAFNRGTRWQLINDRMKRIAALP